MIKIKQRTECTLRNGDYYDDVRIKEVYILGIKVWEFKWVLDRNKDNEEKSKKIGF